MCGWKQRDLKYFGKGQKNHFLDPKSKVLCPIEIFVKGCPGWPGSEHGIFHFIIFFSFSLFH
jgi:hypothetical protein